jgi:6-pyruvoyl-tetrahydropterin synthase
VEREIPAAHHNGPPGSRCHANHGHDWRIEVEITYDELDEYGWGPDFSVIKRVIDHFDHQDLNERIRGEPPSAEVFARVLCTQIHAATGRRPDFVRVHEGHGNSVCYRPSVRAAEAGSAS